MNVEKFEVIIVGGSYAGLAAGMGLGRALRATLIIDSALPCNRYTPRSHNFLTHDGRSPDEIALIARQQVDQYKSIKRVSGLVVSADKLQNGFEVALADGTRYGASNLVFATGIVDLMPEIRGFGECWGKSVLHCPYCHGYEVKDVETGILGNGDHAFEFGSLISNWTSKLTIYTNGPSTLNDEQAGKLQSHNIQVVEDRIEFFEHHSGYIERIVFSTGGIANVEALYARPGFRQQCDLPKFLGCEISSDGYILVDSGQRTTISGVYACGDNVTRMRTVANAIAMGTTTAITLNKDMIMQSF